MFLRPDGMPTVWNLESGETRDVVFATTRADHFAVNADLRIVVARLANGLGGVWDLETGRLRRELPNLEPNVAAAVLSADGCTLAMCCGFRLRAWNVATGQLRHVLWGHDHWLSSIALSADGRTLVSGSLDKTIRVWDLDVDDERDLTCPEAGENERLLEGEAQIRVAAGHRCSMSLRWDGALSLWDDETGRLQQVLREAEQNATPPALTSDRRVAVVKHSGKTLRVWNMETGAHAFDLCGHTDEITGFGLTPDG